MEAPRGAQGFQNSPCDPSAAGPMVPYRTQVCGAIWALMCHAQGLSYAQGPKDHTWLYSGNFKALEFKPRLSLSKTSTIIPVLSLQAWYVFIYQLTLTVGSS